MKIAIIGSTYPYKGGIAKHTTMLAHKLDAAGHEVTLFSWRHQYPFFYPGNQYVPDNEPEVALYPSVIRCLSWRNPIRWWQVGKTLKQFDTVIFVWWVPLIQGPVYRIILAALGTTTHRILLCHNVVRHETGRFDAALFRSIAARVNRLIVHSKSQAALARAMTITPVVQAILPPVLPALHSSRHTTKQRHKRLLFFGFVRPYKGLDILLRAIAPLEAIELVVAGEMWEKNEVHQLIAELGIGERVTVLDRYLADSELQDLFETADALVLPYRSSSGTFNATLGHHYGLPVIATRVGNMAEQVDDGVDGVLCAPSDVAALQAAIQYFYEGTTAKTLQAGARKRPVRDGWAAYLLKLTK